jgi:RimJ/RimL family protein N-acetyltransferase
MSLKLQRPTPPGSRRASRRASELAAVLEGNGDRDTLLASIEATLAEPRLFARGWPLVLTALRRDPWLDRARVAKALLVLRETAGQSMAADSLRGVARLAFACHDPRTARAVLDELADCHKLSARDILLRAECNAVTGNLSAARDLCGIVLAREPGNLDAHRLSRRWSARVLTWREPWAGPIAAGHDFLLEPLHADHAPALLWQYRDPEISIRTGLPPAEPSQRPEDWVAGRLAERGLPYAFIHRDEGPVGYAEYVLDGSEAFLCLWIGTDWQGRGWGRHLIATLIRHARDSGIDLVLTAAYETNHTSLAALSHCGLVSLPLRAQPPDDDRIFLYYPSRCFLPGEVPERLIDFLGRIESGISFVTPQTVIAVLSATEDT